MGIQNKICQSCGMPLQNDPNQGGTEADGSISDQFCGFCFKDGSFLDEGISLSEKINKNIQIAVTKLKMDEDKARTLAESIIPYLDRWKK